MFTPTTRIILIVLNLIFATFYFFQDKIGLGSGFLIAAALFVYGYFKDGTVYLAFKHLKKQQFDKAEQLLTKIKNPDLLAKGQRAYYHFSKGIIAAHREQWTDCLSELQLATKTGLRTENDQSIALLGMAEAAFELNQIPEAQAYIDQVKGLKIKPLVKQELKGIEDKINST